MKWLKASCFILFSFSVLALPALARDLPQLAPGVTCRAYLVYEMHGGRYLASCHPEVRQPIASLTKLMTAIIACERLRFDGRYVLTPKEQATFGVDTMRADKMLELMLVPSNNSVCRVVARIVAGDEARFAQLMNERARQLGLHDTCFKNATGLPAEGQYSTSGDVLVLALAALRYPALRRALCLPATDLNGRTLKATLDELYRQLPGLQGGKTGYTRAAGRCLVLYYRAPQPQGGDYVIVSLGSKGVKESFTDALRILQYHGLLAGAHGGSR